MQAPNQQEISDEGRIVVQGALPHYNLEPAQASHVFWLQTFIQHFNEAEECYSRLLADGRLIGQERLELMQHLDHAMNHLMALRRLLERGAERFSIVDLFHDFELHVRIQPTQNRWIGEGQLGRKRRLNSESLSVWFGNTRRRRLTALVRAVGEALRDGVISPKEKGQLCGALDRVIFSFLLLRERISSGDIT